MATYRVSMWIPVSTSIDVEADTIDGAIDAALENAPAATNSSNNGIDEAGEWTAVAVYDESNAEVWAERGSRHG
jgi:hypothetical protein